jgi:uncharacterized protein YrzB (UPF0473 family)
MANENENVVTLLDEDGNVVELEVLDEIDYEGEKFGVFLPMEEDADEVIILKITEDVGGEFDFESIDDDAKLDAIFNIFMERAEEDFEFVD